MCNGRWARGVGEGCLGSMNVHDSRIADGRMLTRTAGTSVGPTHPGSHAAPRRAARGLRVTLGLAAAAVALIVAAVGVLWPATPAVADAGARVHAILAAHDGTALRTLPEPDRVGQALIATEDSRFRSTPGVDPVALARVVWSTVRGTGDTGGAGLAQQLAKNLYHPTGSAIWSEVQQVELAFKLEHSYSKDDILRMYLSAVYFGHGYYGVTQASRGYFGVDPSKLTWGQAALLAGLVQAPSADDPIDHPQRAVARERHVLRRLVATGVLGTAQAEAIAAQGLQLSA